MGPNFLATADETSHKAEEATEKWYVYSTRVQHKNQRGQQHQCFAKQPNQYRWHLTDQKQEGEMLK